MLLILDPRADGSALRRDSGPDAGNLRGKRVGIRLDEFWESWNWVSEEWATALRDAGAVPVLWRAPVVKGEKVAKGTEEFKQFLEEIDVAIVGLCNCGSCTLWAIHDAVAALDRDIPTVAVATAHFERLARVLGEKNGRPELRLQVLPYPLEGQLEPVVREIARAAFPSVLGHLGATV